MRNCGSHIGQAYLADEVYGVDFGENWISVSPEVDYDATLVAVQKTVDAYPGLYRDVQTYLRERIKEVLTGSSEAIVVRIYGPDLEVLREKAKEIEKLIGGVDGVVDAHASLQTSVPHIMVEPDLEAARKVGLTPGDIRRQSSTMIASEEVSDIFADGRAYDVHVTAIPSARDSVTDVENMQLDTPDGSRVLLKDVATITLGATPNAIERQNQSRRIDVGANIAGGDLGAVVDDVEELVAGVGFARGYYAEVMPCARLKYSWISCSQVIAIPPWICTASAATLLNASLAENRASAAEVTDGSATASLTTARADCTAT